MISFPHIDPVIFGIGPIQVRWYGLMYVLGFVGSYLLTRHQIRRFRVAVLEPHFENLNFVMIISLVLGARLGYVVFYNPGYYLHHPLEIVAVWQGGMSFHGGLLMLMLGGFLFCWKNSLNFWQTADLYTVTMPIGLGLGRIGNFINGELYGRVTDVPWAMVFPGGGSLPRHPSQLYESFLEGLVLFVTLWYLKDVKHRRHWPDGSMLAAFLIGYGTFRCLAELFRQPDEHLGFIAAFLTMGQLLSAAMILAGTVLFLLVRRR